MPQGRLVGIGDWTCIENLQTSVELGRVGHGASGVRDRGRASDEGADRAGVQVRAQEGYAELIEDPPPAARTARMSSAFGVRLN